MLQIEDVLRDRGSRYAVSGGDVVGRAGAAAFIADLRRPKKFAKATHHSWAAVLGGEVTHFVSPRIASRLQERFTHLGWGVHRAK